MRLTLALLLVALLSVNRFDRSTTFAVSLATPNDNRGASGSLRDGVLTIELEATIAHWYPRSESARRCRAL